MFSYMPVAVHSYICNIPKIQTVYENFSIYEFHLRLFVVICVVTSVTAAAVAAAAAQILNARSSNQFVEHLSANRVVLGVFCCPRFNAESLLYLTFVMAFPFPVHSCCLLKYNSLSKK